MTITFLYSGQGVHLSPSIVAAADSSGVGRNLLDMAETLSAVDLREASRRHSRDLDRTEVLQPALVAVALGITHALRSAGIDQRLLAGHSVGELAAWSAAGSITAEECVRLASTRGRLMARDANKRPGGMVILHGDEADLRRALDTGRRSGTVVMAGQNAPNHWILSGEHSAIATIDREFETTRLDVEGPWHSDALANAQQDFEEALQQIEVSNCSTELVTGLSGDLAPADSEQARLALAEQLTHPIRWREVMLTCKRLGTTAFVTVGPGKVLRSLVRLNLGTSIPVYTTESPQDLDRTIGVLTSQ